MRRAGDAVTAAAHAAMSTPWTRELPTGPLLRDGTGIAPEERACARILRSCSRPYSWRRSRCALLFCVAVVGLDAWGWGDEPDYHRHAADIAAGRGFLTPAGEPTAARPPLYPIVLAGVYRVFGPSHAAGRILQMALGVAIVLLTYFVTRKLFSEGAGLAAAAFAAGSPALVYLSALLMTENLAIVLLLLMLLLLAREIVAKEIALPRLALGGLLGGLSCLTRPDSALFVLSVPAAALVFGKAPARRRAAGAALFVLVAAVTVLPWAARNRTALGEWIAFTTHGGITFYESNNMRIVEEPAFRGSVVLPGTAVPRWDELEPLGEVELDRKAWEMGRQFVREHADLMPRMMVWKFERLWRFRSGLQVSGAEGAVQVAGGRSLGEIIRGIDVGWVYSIVAIPLFLLGTAATARRWRSLALLYAVVVSHTLVALAFHGSLRARSPVEPVIAVFAGAAVAAILTRARLRPRPAPVAVVAVALAALILPGPARAQSEGRYENTYQKDFVMDAPWRVRDASTPIPVTISPQGLRHERRPRASLDQMLGRHVGRGAPLGARLREREDRGRPLRVQLLDVHHDGDRGTPDAARTARP